MCRGQMPITPPQVRLPISTPRPICLNAWLKMSPSEPAGSPAAEAPHGARARPPPPPPYRQRHLLLGQVDEQLARGDPGPHRDPVDGEHLVAGAYVDALPVQRRGRLRVPHVADQYPGD